VTGARFSISKAKLILPSVFNVLSRVVKNALIFLYAQRVYKPAFVANVFHPLTQFRTFVLRVFPRRKKKIK
jgi:hypothetical protein